MNELEILLRKIYDKEKLNEQVLRYSDLIDKFEEKFNEKDYKLFSSPGRTEIGGNHTDHNHGKVIAASINLDSIAVASPAENNEVVLYSTGFKKPFIVNLSNTKVVEEEKGSTTGLIRGIAAGFKNYGYKVGGFNAHISSDVIIGSGLSSSASIEVLIGKIFSYFYNADKIPYLDIALISQYAENVYFGKPCGLMDQVACAAGGIVSIDFCDPKKPKIKKVKFDFLTSGYRLIVVDTEAHHADLTEDYASIPSEMKQVANYFNKEYCREISLDELLPEIKSLRKRVGDRAILRAIHFLEENKRVDKQVEALNKNNFKEFLKLINESGNSSFKYLQNIFSPNKIKEQSISLALSLSEMFIKEKGEGACRVHGGGFAGTIQVFLPEKLIEDYILLITKVFKKESVKILTVRSHGVICLNDI